MIHYTRIIIKQIIIETPTTKTFVFQQKIEAKPGQFIMITDFEHGEKPFSLSAVTENSFSLTIKTYGKFSEHINQLQEGDMLYFRGPYGNHFSVPEKNKSILLIGGGTGMAPIRFLTNYYLKKRIRMITVINGARSRSEMLYRREFGDLNVRYIPVTDDGSEGKKQTASEAMRVLLLKEHFDMCYIAGPEPMLKSAFTIAQDQRLNGEYLLERYMKCGVGICGSCSIDPAGIILCVDGPVLSGEKLQQLTEFGSYHREATGARVAFAGT